MILKIGIKIMHRFVLTTIEQVQSLVYRFMKIDPRKNQPVYEVTVQEYKKNRSLSQNRLLWLWYKEIADHIKDSTGQIFSDEEMHDWFREKFLPTKFVEFRGEIVKSRKSTKSLKVKEFTEYLEQIDFYCGSDLGLRLSHPDDLYWEAFGINASKN